MPLFLLFEDATQWLELLPRHLNYRIFTSVMRHLIKWYDPSAKPPGSNSPNVISYTWDALVVSHVMPHRKFSQVFLPDTLIRRDVRLSAQEMVDRIWVHSSTYARDFLPDDVRPTVS